MNGPVESGEEMLSDADEPSYTQHDYSRLRIGEFDERYIFEVCVVDWHGHEPHANWKRFRTWQRQPSQKQLDLAWSKALREKRFFRACDECGDLTNVGHMHGLVCQRCAEHAGVVF